MMPLKRRLEALLELVPDNDPVLNLLIDTIEKRFCRIALECDSEEQKAVAESKTDSLRSVA